MDASNLCHDASFDLFSRPPTEVGLQDFHDEEVQPLTAISASTTAIDFTISGEGDEYIDLSELRLFLRVKVADSAGADPENDTISLIKYWPSSLIRQCDMFLNGTLVTTSSNMYNYNAYASALLSFPKAVKDHQLQVLEHSEGWKVEKANPTNEALIRLHLPLCNQPRLIPNGVQIKLRMLRSSDDFLFKRLKDDDTKTYKITLEKCSLFVRRVTPTANLLLEHAELISKMNYVYPIERLYPKFFTLSSGVREFDLPNISQGQLPSRIIVGFVKTASFSGSLSTNPYKFEHFGLDYISLQSNGRAFPAVPLTADYSKNYCRRAYHSLLDTVQGPCEDNESLGLSLDEYMNNSCFYGFTLSKALAGPSAALPRRENGYVNAKIRFINALPANVNAIFFLEYNNYLEIDNARNIYLDYAA